MNNHINKTIFSGIQPSGMMTIGNYLGAIKQWVSLQDDNDCVFSIVDLHAITIYKQPDQLRNNILLTCALLLACGIDPKKSILFLQSQNPDHTSLAWYLQCISRVGWLYRMTQFKDKAKIIAGVDGSNQENVSVGLLTYPVLQAADVLLYDTQLVPVGLDQAQHIELIRDIANKANHDYQSDMFVLPKSSILDETGKIMSLTDGSKKMSKSGEESSYLGLFDDDDVLVKKIKRAKSDSDLLPSNVKDLDHRLEAKNLLTLMASLTSQSLEQVVSTYANHQFSALKKDLQEIVVEVIRPIRTTAKQYLKDPLVLLHVLQNGLEQAKARSTQKLRTVQTIMTGV